MLLDASPLHRCHAVPNENHTPTLQYQAETCLCEAHRQCPRFLRAAPIGDVVKPPPRTDRRSKQRTPMILAALATLMVLLAIAWLAFSFFGAGVQDLPGAPAVALENTPGTEAAFPAAGDATEQATEQATERATELATEPAAGQATEPTAQAADKPLTMRLTPRPSRTQTLPATAAPPLLLLAARTTPVAATPTLAATPAVATTPEAEQRNDLAAHPCYTYADAWGRGVSSASQYGQRRLVAGHGTRPRQSQRFVSLCRRAGRRQLCERRPL